MVRADVPLSALEAEAEAVVGSFTVDGLTYAIDGEGQVALVAVAPLEGAEGVEAEGEGSGAEGAEPEADGEPDGIQLESSGEADGATLTLPAVVSYGGTDYSLVRIAPLALDGCGAAALSIPSSVETVDTAAALGCDTLAEVTVAEDNPSFSVFDGYLIDKAQTSILLVPEGRVGQLRIASTIQDLDPRAFSHCTRITFLDADAGCPGLTSWNGSIYTSDLATLVRVPAGARTVTLPPECSAIGASAFSGCTELESIEVQGSVESIAPSAFGEIEEATPLVAQSDTAQITGLVAVANSALSSIQIDKASIAVTLPDGADPSVWDSAGFTHVASSKGDEATADPSEAEGPTPGTLASSVISEETLLDSASSYAASSGTMLDESGEVAASWTLDAAGTLTLSGVAGRIIAKSYGLLSGRPWGSVLSSVKKIVFDDVDAYDPSYWFHGASNVASIEIKGNRFFPSATTMRAMFYGCAKVASLPEGFYIPPSVKDLDYLFWDCRLMTSLPSTLALSYLPSSVQLHGKDPSSIEYRDGYPFTHIGFNDGSTIATSWNGRDVNRLVPANHGYTTVDSFWKTCNFRTVAASNRYSSATYHLPAQGDEEKLGAQASWRVWGVQSNGMSKADYVSGPAVYAPTGFAFVGWFTNKECTPGNEFDPASLEGRSSNIDVYGKFQRGTYSITYLEEEGGAVVGSDDSFADVSPEFFLQPSYSYGERVIIDAVPVREGYEFLGWTIEGITGDTPQKQAVIPAGTTGDKVAVAHWAELPKKNYLYTVKDGSGAAGSTSPQAWWTLDNSGRLYIQCDSENGETAVIAQRNFPDWWYNNPDRKEAWGAVRDQVRSIVISESFEVEQSATYTYEYVRANASSSDCREARNEGMSWWFTWMPNLKDISGLRIPDGIVCAGLFWGSWGLETLEGAYGTFKMPESCGNWNGLLGSTALKELPEGFTIPNGVFVSRCLFQGVPLSMLPEGFSIPSSVIIGSGIFKNCPELSSLPESLKLYGISSDNSMFRFDATQDVASYPREYVEWYKQRAGGGILPAKPVRTLYTGNLADLLPSGASGTAKDYWLASYNRELVGPGDLTSPQSAVRFQVPKADGSGYVSYDVLADSSGRVTAPAVTRYGYSKVTWRYDTGTTGADLGHIAASGPCGSAGLAFDASGLPDIKAGLKGPVYAEVSGLMLSMDMPVGSGNLWYAIDCGEVMALGPSASTRKGMEDAHELKFESYTPVPTELSATFTANDAADGTPSAEKLFPSGLDEGTGFALSLDGGASESAGFKALIDAGGSQGFSSLASLDASPSVREPGRASGTLALKLGGTNDADFAEETTEYSVADIVWTLDASAQYDFWVSDDTSTYSTYEIKRAAEAISAYGATADVPAFRQFNRYLQQQGPDVDPVFSIKVYDQPDGTASTHKVDVLGIAQDTKASGGKAGLSFGWHDIYALNMKTDSDSGGVFFDTKMHSKLTNSGGWDAMDLQSRLQSSDGFSGMLRGSLQDSIQEVMKKHQMPGNSVGTTRDTLFILSSYEVFGTQAPGRATSETSANSFHYQYFAKGGVGESGNVNIGKTFNGTKSAYWTRSAHMASPDHFVVVMQTGVTNAGSTTNPGLGVVPCFCF